MLTATDRRDSVWVQVASADGNFHAIVNTNGRERYTTNTSGKAPHPALVNITPDVHFGRANDLVIGGLNTDSQTPSPMALTYVRLYFVPPHASPAGPSASR